MRSLLLEQLTDAGIEWPRGGNRYFVPISKIAQLVTPQSIHDELAIQSSPVPGHIISEYAPLIHKHSSKLFAILVIILKSSSILEFVDENITDDDLPLVRFYIADPQQIRSDRNSFALCGEKRKGHPIAAMKNWSQRDVKSFSRDQWSFLAPVFSNGKHYKFDDNTILPFVEDQEGQRGKVRSGGYSQVWGIRIHRDHQHLYNTSHPLSSEPMLAVKRLQTSEEDDFLRETHISKILARYEHPHLVRLLATYELSGRFHLLFPYAKQNLHTYWEHHSRPKWNRETILWILKQFEGIVSGLSLIHHLRQSTLGSPELDNDNTSMTYSQGPFGYHGDIKPENILWFNDIPGVGQEGVLQIGDFGLGKFRSQLNVSKLDSQKAFGSRTYEPPETALGGPVSSAGDMWSLGCIYLECIIWLLEGWARLEEFFDGRSLVVGEGIEDDKFYTLVKIAHGSAQGEVQGAIVRFSVQDWINGLYNHPLCSSLIRDLLALVQKKLLVVDAKSRATSAQLQDELERLVLKAEVDDKYLLSRVN